MDTAVIHENLVQRFGDAVGEATLDVPDPFISVSVERLAEVARFLRDEPGYQLDYLAAITAVDRGDTLQVVYHLLSIEHRHAVVLKVEVPRDRADVPTVSSIWPAANWHEREQFDLLGVTFTGHPDLRRILLPEDWVGYPLRKDYVEPREYHGISHERPAVLDQLKAADASLQPPAKPSPDNGSKPVPT
jgi:NADH-quinone oxidoreductase subunit C